MKLLEETAARISNPIGRKQYPPTDISTSQMAYLPDNYIADSSQKLELYSRISKLRKLEEAELLQEEILDRFGKLPDRVENLFLITQLRILGQKIGIETLLFQDKKVRLNFNPEVLPKLTSLEEAFVKSDGLFVLFFLKSHSVTSSGKSLVRLFSGDALLPLQ